MQVALAQQGQNKMDKGYIFFVRHGQTDWNIKRLMQGRDEIPLNEVGISQANEAAQLFKESSSNSGVHFDRVITSPLSRASVTGKAIADAIGCTDFSTDDRIIERDFGELSGKPYEFSAPYIVGDADYVKGLEPVCSVLGRVDSFIKEVVKPNTNIIAVTHGSVSGVFASRSKKRDGVDPTGKILHNCHMVVYSYDGNEIIMEGYDISPREIGSLDLK